MNFIFKNLLKKCIFTIFICRWIVDLDGAPGTLFEGEKFQLAFKFGSRYPFDSPQVRVITLI